MRRNIHILLALLMVGSVWGQHNTNSPYSRYGYGILDDNLPVAYRAMGSVGIGLRNKSVINAAQPASHSALDSTSFKMDLAMSGLVSSFSDINGQMTKGNGNLEYLTIQFPFWKYIGFSVGVLPYSHVGYDYSLSDSIGSDYHYTKSYQGNGGISEVYAGLSFNILDWVSLGANVYYMFGSTVNIRSLTYDEAILRPVDMYTYMDVSSWRFRYGLQFFHTFDKHSFCAGAIFENKRKLSADCYQAEINTLDSIRFTDAGFEVPMTYGVGLSYTYDSRLTIAADYSCQEWAKTMYFGATDTLRSRSTISVGAEYIHDPASRKYIHRMAFRLGCNVSNSYVMNENSKDFSLSLGLGFPLRTSMSMVNTTFEYGHRGNRATLAENYFKLTIGVAIHEMWFVKRRL